VVLLNDEILMEKLRGGDQKAFAHMLHTYSKLLWVAVGGILGGIGTTQESLPLTPLAFPLYARAALVIITIHVIVKHLYAQ